MPKINVYLPDELAEAVKEAGIPVSAVCQRALEQAVRRVTAIRETTLGALDDADLAARLPHFTARTREAIKLSFEQARAAGSSVVGSGYLLGGLLAHGENLALRVLGVMEINPEQVARELARQGLDEAGVATEDSAQRLSGFASNALELAVTESSAFGHSYVGSEHLLLGLISEPDGVAGQILRSLGAELRLTRRAVAAALAGYMYLHANTPQAGSSSTADTADALADVVRQELGPIMQRLERIEGRIGMVAES